MNPRRPHYSRAISLAALFTTSVVLVGCSPTSHDATQHKETAPPAKARESRQLFDALDGLDWNTVMHDACTRDWTEYWTLDGLKARVTNSPDGMDFWAGPNRREDASHAVLWTKDSFDGDIRLDYEYTKLDEIHEAVTILYILATGSGEDGFPVDISEWKHKRTIPSMGLYFRHMHTYHISYAAFDISNTDSTKDYIRARRYRPERPEGLKGTDLEPDYSDTGLFEKGVGHNVTVIKKGDDLFMFIRNDEREHLCHWKTDSFDPITEGRIGLRHMWTRGARYRDFRVSQLKH